MTQNPKENMPLHWSDGFSGSRLKPQWVNGRSSCFPRMGPTNPGDHKLDHLNPSAVIIDNHRLNITATKRPDGRWNTGLVTTERAEGGVGFELKPGDYWETKFTLPTEKGAWFSVWTWGRDLSTGVQPGHGEVDVVEWHWDNPSILELSNHVRRAGKYFRSDVVGRGKTVFLGTHFTTNSCDWYLNGAKIFEDRRGVPSNWRGWPILELSVSDGYYHPRPDHSRPIRCSFEWTRVYR